MCTGSVSISLLYMSALSFDPAFIAYLKSETTYGDPFIAGMRSLCVITGLMGTFLAPYLTKKIGSVRAGTWSLIALCLPLIPVIVALFLAGPSRSKPAWNGALLFLGMALSRIGLWAFDLVQLAQVQVSELHAHQLSGADSPLFHKDCSVNAPSAQQPHGTSVLAA